MHDAAGWFLDARAARIFVIAWFAAVVVHGVWRSRGDAPLDPVRESGPGA